MLAQEVYVISSGGATRNVREMREKALRILQEFGAVCLGPVGCPSPQPHADSMDVLEARSTRFSDLLFVVGEIFSVNPTELQVPDAFLARVPRFESRLMLLAFVKVGSEGSHFYNTYAVLRDIAKFSDEPAIEVRHLNSESEPGELPKTVLIWVGALNPE